MKRGTAAICYLGHEFKFKLLSVCIRRGIVRKACMWTGQVTSTCWRKCSSYLAASNCELCRRSSLGVHWSKLDDQRAMQVRLWKTALPWSQSFQALRRQEELWPVAGSLPMAVIAFRCAFRRLTKLPQLRELVCTQWNLLGIGDQDSAEM